MKPIGRFIALAVVSIVALAACSGDDDDSNPTASSGGENITSSVPPPAATITGATGPAEYTYAIPGLEVTVDLDGSEGTMRVENGTENDLEAPDIYALDALDGHEIEGEVLESAPIPAGRSATFDVTLDGIDAQDIGLLFLLFGAENLGAFVRTG
jgi:hypothetical protein